MMLVGCHQSPPADEKPLHLETAFQMVATAVQDPSLHLQVKSIEEVEYTPEGVVTVMFSAFGAGVWPPPDLPQDIKVLRKSPPAAWSVVLTTESDGFLVTAYQGDTAEPAHQKKIDFPPPEN
ncbi:MAG: hypothetical protein KC800_17680 [Candidatus Eremiobacteraeota bacterium]|nr:hypothetical protein [Candidatus Eremiobacteraeota bacterium]